MSVLITYATSHGSTREIAEYIAQRLRLHLTDVRLLPIEEAPNTLEPLYAAVVLGSPVHGGSWIRPARQYLKTAPPPKHAWAFSVGMADGEAKVGEAAAVEKALRASWPRLHGHRLFRGRFAEKDLPWWMRLCIACIPADEFSYGDVRNWDAIGAWTDEIAAEMRGLGIGISVRSG